MMAVIPPAVLPRVGSLLRLLGSDQDHEALGAVRALRRTLGGVGLDLHDLASVIERPAAAPADQPPASPADRNRRARPGDITLLTATCRRVREALRRALDSGRLSKWETDFANSLVERLDGGGCRISKKQGDALGRLLAKVGEGSAWA